MKRYILFLVGILALCLVTGCVTEGYIKPKGRVVMGGSIEG